MGKNQPTIQYRQGKFDPEITIKDSSMNGESIKMFKGSVIKGEGFELIMPDDDKIKSEISFGGKMVLTTLNKEPRIVESVKMHQSMKPKSFVEDGAYKNVVMQNNPTIVIPAGGFGERIYNISGENENKPSTRLATDERFRVMGTALNLAVASGAYNADGTDDVQYVSQKHVLNNANKNVTHVSEYRTDGGAIAEALERGIIPQGQDIMIFNADVFTNADPTRPYNALKTLPYAGLVIPYYNVAPQKAQPFGLLSVEKDKNDNLKIVDFFEKEKYNVEPQEEDFEDEQKYLEALAKYQRIQGARNPENPDYYLTNPGFYFMTPEVAKVLVDKLNENPDETGLGKHVMPRVVELMEKGELTDKNGNPLRAYTLPLQRKTGEDAVWYDIGKADAFLDLVKDVAKETSEHYNTTENKYYGVPSFIMEDFKDHYDPESRIVFQSEKAMASLSIFKEKYNIDDEDIYGNIYVAE